MKKFTLFIVTIICITILCAMSVSGDSMIAPYQYSIELQNGSLIFYMTPSYEWYEPGEGEILIESGLYSKNSDNSLENIYKISEEYFYEHDVIISSDGIYFAVIPWADSDTVITFYKSGERQRSYTSQELMKDIKNVQHTASHYFWENSDERSFDSTANELSITTLDKMEYTFDLTSGTIVSENNDNSNNIIVIIAGIFIAAVWFAGGVMIFRILRKRHKKR